VSEQKNIPNAKESKGQIYYQKKNTYVSKKTKANKSS